MALGAIVKSAAGSLAKQQGKKIATDKLMGRKPKALPAAGQTGASKKDTAMNMVSSMASKSPMQGPEIPASKQTINVSAQTVGGDVGSGGGGSAIVKQVQDISVVVATIADSMKGNLVLKEKAQSKARKAAERDKRAAQEKETEKPDKPKDKGGGFPPVKVPGVGLLQGIFGFITKFLYGVVILKLIDFLPQLMKLMPLFKAAGGLIKILFGVTGFALNALAGFVDFGYKLVQGAENIVGKVFGAEGAEKFRTFMENLKNLVTAFLVWKIIGQKIFTQVIKNIKFAFNLAKNIISKGFAIFNRLTGNLGSKILSKTGNIASKILSKGTGLLSKGASKVGGFASKIFGKAAKFVSPALKGALPAVKGFAGRIPILGPIIVGIVSLMSGEPAAQALFKAGGAALGGALGTFIPIPVLGTLIGETIGVFVGDLLYELIMGGGMEAVAQKLKDTLSTLLSGGKFVFDFFKSGFSNFISTFMEEHSFTLPGWLAGTIKRTIGLDVSKLPNLLQLYNPMVTVPLFIKSFFGKKEGSGETNLKQEEAKISDDQTKTNGQNAEQVASETTYESGEGNSAIIPIPLDKSTSSPSSQTMMRQAKFGRYKRTIDEISLALYAGK